MTTASDRQCQINLALELRPPASRLYSVIKCFPESDRETLGLGWFVPLVNLALARMIRFPKSNLGHHPTQGDFTTLHSTATIRHQGHQGLQIQRPSSAATTVAAY